MEVHGAAFCMLMQSVGYWPHFPCDDVLQVLSWTAELEGAMLELPENGFLLRGRT